MSGGICYHPLMKKSILIAALLALAAPAGAQKLDTEQQKTLYALGQSIAQDIEPFHIKPEELPFVTLGLKDAVGGARAQVRLADYKDKLAALLSGRRDSGARQFMVKAAKEKGAVRTASGMVYKILKKGRGKSPQATDTVEVHYHGTRTDGSVFDSSVTRGRPSKFPLNGVIACWTEGVQMMKVGAKHRLTCPPHLAYGERGHPPSIKPGAVLIFDIELFSIGN